MAVAVRGGKSAGSDVDADPKRLGGLDLPGPRAFTTIEVPRSD
jgi:hypothetical protein